MALLSLGARCSLRRPQSLYNIGEPICTTCILGNLHNRSYQTAFREVAICPVCSWQFTRRAVSGRDGNKSTITNAIKFQKKTYNLVIRRWWARKWVMFRIVAPRQSTVSLFLHKQSTGHGGGTFGDGMVDGDVTNEWRRSLATVCWTTASLSLARIRSKSDGCWGVGDDHTTTGRTAIRQRQEDHSAVLTSRRLDHILVGRWWIW